MMPETAQYVDEGSETFVWLMSGIEEKRNRKAEVFSKEFTSKKFHYSFRFAKK
jgi:hypothetical protein